MRQSRTHTHTHTPLQLTVDPCLSVFPYLALPMPRHAAMPRPFSQVICSVNNSLYCGPVEKFGTEEQKKKWCVKIIFGGAKCL